MNQLDTCISYKISFISHFFSAFVDFTQNIFEEDVKSLIEVESNRYLAPSQPCLFRENVFVGIFRIAEYQNSQLLYEANRLNYRIANKID